MQRAVARRSRLVLAGIPILLALLFFTSLRTYRDQLAPVEPGSGRVVVVEIPRGASSGLVGAILEREGLVRSGLVFRLYSRWKHLDVSLKPGEYQLSPELSLPEIAAKISRGEVTTYSFTVPEGLTVEQIADLLAGEKLVDRDKFLEAARKSRLAADFVPAGAKVKEPMEGYLFPETYQVTKGASEEDIIALMFRGFTRVFTPELQARAKELGYSVHEIVTLASIIEEEARVPEERATISAVYHNRLRIGMKLDADPTVRYALPEPKERLLYKDLEINSPYNTYRYPGLPPGPISNPGEAAIRAALFPADVDYLYFVAKGDGSGGHYFARTLAEHNRNRSKVKR